MKRFPRDRTIRSGRRRLHRARLAGPALLLGVLATAACSHRPEAESGSGASVAQSPAGSGYKVGRPYQIKGIWYYPEVNYEYSEVGVASWYGPGFNGKATANGETYDQNDLTAAHKTLPLPTIVRVTNLENGRSVKVRINDRGPFVDGRIIDMSRRGAQLLGFYGAGTAQVQVDVVADESYALAQSLGAAQPPPAVLAGRTPAAPAPVVVAAADTSSPRLAGGGRGAANGSAPAIGAVAMAPIWSPGDPQPPGTEPAVAVAMAPVWSPGDPPPAGEAPATPVGMVTTADLPEIEPAHAVAPAAHRWSVVTPAAAAEPDLGGLERRTWVQAGAFADPQRASRARQRLASIGPTVISPHVVNGRELSRVRVGPLHSPEEADRVLAWVSEAGFADCRIVSE